MKKRNPVARELRNVNRPSIIPNKKKKIKPFDKRQQKLLGWK